MKSPETNTAKHREKEISEVRGNPTREAISGLLKSIGPKGKKRKEKLEAIEKLNLQNPQGMDLVEDIQTYAEF